MCTFKLFFLLRRQEDLYSVPGLSKLDLESFFHGNVFPKYTPGSCRQNIFACVDGSFLLFLLLKSTTYVFKSGFGDYCSGPCDLRPSSQQLSKDLKQECRM